MDYVLIGLFFAACSVVNRWAFRKDVKRAIAYEAGQKIV